VNEAAKAGQGGNAYTSQEPRQAPVLVHRSRSLRSLRSVTT
jgi:hypothetical protein